MKNIQKPFLLAVLSAGILFSSCKKDFLDINDNPNQPTDANMTAELIFPAAAEGAAATIVGARASGAGARSSMQFAQNWVGYMASNGDFARDNTETSYNIDFNFGNTLFLTRYGVLYDLHQAEVKGLATGDTAVAGASIILSAKLFQELVDLFGNIPYSQAFQPDAYPRPAYDKAQDIYASLQTRLDTAIEYMQKTVPEVFITADIVNHGNTAKWIKLANTLKLRLLIRQSKLLSAPPAAEIAKIQANGGVLDMGESVTVNPGYVNEEDKQSPFYANYGYTVTNARATTGVNANAYIINILSSTSDPRLGRFFDPAGSAFKGNPYGLAAGLLTNGAGTSYFGPGIIGSASQDQWLMPSFESLFFRAEAEARGWLPGDAQATLNDAIRESFIFLGLDTTDANNYIDNNPDITTIPAGSADEKAAFIAFQKYIANTTIDAQESYSDIRRLNFLPDNGYISKNEGRVSNTLPVRLLYPQSEYTTNSENVNKEGTINAFTSKLFWQ